MRRCAFISCCAIPIFTLLGCGGEPNESIADSTGPTKQELPVESAIGSDATIDSNVDTVSVKDGNTPHMFAEANPNLVDSGGDERDDPEASEQVVTVSNVPFEYQPIELNVEYTSRPQRFGCTQGGVTFRLQRDHKSAARKIESLVQEGAARADAEAQVRESLWKYHSYLVPQAANKNCINELVHILNEFDGELYPDDSVSKKLNSANVFRPGDFTQYYRELKSYEFRFTTLDAAKFLEIDERILSALIHNGAEHGAGFEEWEKNRPQYLADLRALELSDAPPCEQLAERSKSESAAALLENVILENCPAVFATLESQGGIPDVNEPFQRSDGSFVDIVVFAHKQGAADIAYRLIGQGYQLRDQAEQYFRSAVFDVKSGPDEAVVDDLIESGLLRGKNSFSNKLMTDAVIGGRMRIARSLAEAGLATIPGKPDHGIKTVSIDERAVHFEEASGYRCQGNVAEYLICTPTGRNGVFDTYASVRIDSARIEFYKGTLASIYLYYIDCGGSVNATTHEIDDRTCSERIAEAVTSKYGRPKIVSNEGAKEFAWIDPFIAITAAPTGFKAVTDPVYDRYGIKGFYNEVKRGVVQISNPEPAGTLAALRQQLADEKTQAAALREAELAKQQQAQAAADREDL